MTWYWHWKKNHNKYQDGKIKQNWMSMDSWEGSEKSLWYFLVLFLEGQPLAKGAVTTGWELSPGVPGANHGTGKLQREFVEGKTYSQAKQEEMPCSF